MSSFCRREVAKPISNARNQAGWRRIQDAVAYQTRSARPPLEDKLAVVERLELRPVSDAHNRGFGKALGHELHQFLLTGRIERRRRLVHDDDIRMMQHQAHESETLTFAAGQSAVPGSLFVEMLDQIAEAYGRHQFADRPVWSIGWR
jgi:hypothetical protein